MKGAPVFFVSLSGMMVGRKQRDAVSNILGGGMTNMEEKRQEGRRVDDRRAQDRRGTNRRGDSTVKLVKFLIGILVILVVSLFYFFTFG